MFAFLNPSRPKFNEKDIKNWKFDGMKYPKLRLLDLSCNNSI
jgi:hypothetical protein